MGLKAHTNNYIHKKYNMKNDKFVKIFILHNYLVSTIRRKVRYHKFSIPTIFEVRLAC